jgi:hypothetical protein
MHADVTMQHTNQEGVWPQSLYGNFRVMFDEMKFLSQQLNISWGLCKIRDKNGNWTEHIQRVEEDILKVGVRYILQEDKWRPYQHVRRLKGPKHVVVFLLYY